MFVTQETLAEGLLGNEMYGGGEEQNHHHLSSKAAQVAVGMEFRPRDQILEKADTFKYLIQMMSFDNSYWPYVVSNLHISRSKL